MSHYLALTLFLSSTDFTRFRKRNKKHDVSAASRSLSVRAKTSADSSEKNSVDARQRQKSQLRGPACYESAAEGATNSGKLSAARRGKESHNDCGKKTEGSVAGNVLQGAVSAEREAEARTLEEKRQWSIHSGHYDRPTSIRATETRKPVFLDKSVEVFPSNAKGKKPSSSAGQAHDAPAPSRRIKAKPKQDFNGLHYSKANLPDDSDHSKVTEEPSYMPMQVKLDKDVTVLDNVLYAECGDLTSKTFV